MRMGPGLPPALSTHTSVLLTGWTQVLSGSTHLLLAPPQVLGEPAQVLSVFATQVSWGRLQVLSLPAQV
jgi:hypothetical protein